MTRKQLTSAVLAVCLVMLATAMNLQPAIGYQNPLLEVKVVGGYLTAGGENALSISLENAGESNAYDVKAALSVPSSVTEISIVNGSHAVFEQIVYYTMDAIVWMHPVLYVESDCPLGAYSLTLDLEYTDTSDNVYSDSVQIGVAVDAVIPIERTRIAIQNFTVTPTDIFPGDEFTMELELRNWGPSAYDVQVQLTIDAQSPFVSLNPTLIFAGDLKQDETVKVIYDLVSSGDAAAQLHRLSFVISYYDMDDQPASFNEDIAIMVSNIIDFRLLDIQPSTIEASPGESVTIEADLLLLGTETVDFVEVEIVEDHSIAPISTVSESYEYIGRMDPDSPVLFTVQFVVASDAELGDYPIQLQVSCWDGYNQPRQVVITQPITVGETSNPNGAANLTLWDIIWAFIRILFGVTP
ncbi:MAG: hypothetical protein JSV58_02795 [Candidatus Bathyarchaeota archaeon]|nr:MAG: hypothetical protein JSV58_02795 [Candidatus Bathyarchaeota archaeon]